MPILRKRHLKGETYSKNSSTYYDPDNSKCKHYQNPFIIDCKYPEASESLNQVKSEKIETESRFKLDIQKENSNPLFNQENNSIF